MVVFLSSIFLVCLLLTSFAVDIKISAATNNDDRNTTRDRNIAVFIHIGISGLWKELQTCVKNIAGAKEMISRPSLTDYFANNVSKALNPLELNIDVYINFMVQVNQSSKASIMTDLNNIAGIRNIFPTTKPNVGLDMKPFLDQYAEAMQLSYDLGVKLHTKTHSQWRTHSCECLCGTTAHVISITRNFEKNKLVGMITPDGTTFGPSTPVGELHSVFEQYFSTSGPWLAFDKGHVSQMQQVYRELFDSDLNIHTPEDLLIAAGSFYWFRMDSIRAKWGNLGLHNFTRGYVQDRGIEHTLERLLPTMIKKNGLTVLHMIPAPKVIPIYFPQYHAIPENDRFWSPGFTEWTLLKPYEGGKIYKPLSPTQGKDHILIYTVL